MGDGVGEGVDGPEVELLWGELVMAGDGVGESVDGLGVEVWGLMVVGDGDGEGVDGLAAITTILLYFQAYFHQPTLLQAMPAVRDSAP